MNQTWQNSRWLPSSSSVRMHEWSFFVQNGWIQDGKIQDGCYPQVKWEWMRLSQIELVRVRVEWECFWVNQREDNKVSESKMAMAESNRTELKLAAIMKIRINEWSFFVQIGNQLIWVKFHFVQMVTTNLGKCEWIWQEENKDGWILDCRIQDGCHHQVDSEWMSKVLFCANGENQSWQVWVSLTRKTKMAEYKMAEFKMAAILKFSENAMNEVFLCKMAESKMAEFMMAAIIKLSQNEWVWVRLNYLCQNQSGVTNLSKFEWVWEKKTKMAWISNMAEFKMAAILKLSENEWVWIRLN